MTNLHIAYATAVEEVRRRFAKADIGRFKLTLCASGRTMTDRSEVKIEYRLEAGYDCRVKGDTLEACIAEVLRRHGWDERHAPLALPGTTSQSPLASWLRSPYGKPLTQRSSHEVMSSNAK